MHWLTRVISIVLFIVLFLAGIAFITANPESHQLKFLEKTIVESNVGVLILVAFAVGAIVGLLASAPLILGLKRQTKRMQKRLSDKQAEKELSQ